VAGIGDAGQGSPLGASPRQEPWRARCVETRTAGSASGLGKRTSSNAGTAPQADSSQCPSTGRPRGSSVAARDGEPFRRSLCARPRCGTRRARAPVDDGAAGRRADGCSPPSTSADAPRRPSSLPARRRSASTTYRPCTQDRAGQRRMNWPRGSALTRSLSRFVETRSMPRSARPRGAFNRRQCPSTDR
jgi:hypothetical protein